ncbi:MAG TPA: DMT family transporter [Thermomicrobiales bacterium]|nr:DMT family transporter [Thermomicrobiales bacterium]
MMMPPATTSRLPAIACLATGMGIVGTSVTANKYLVGHIPIMLAMEIRFLIATIVLLVIVRLVEAGLPQIPLRLHVVLAAQALFGVVAFNILLLVGLDMTTATISGIITAATPAVIAIMSFLLGDRLPPIAWLGVALTIGGVILVNLLASPSEDIARRPILGAMLIFLAVIGEAAYTILGRYATRSISPFGTATWICIYGAAMFLPLALWDVRHFSPGAVPASTWLAIAWLAIFVTVIAFVLWFKGLASIPASTAGAFTGMIPITAVISAAILLHEPVGIAHLAGMTCVLAGIFLVAQPRATPETTRPPALWRSRRSVPNRVN